MAGNRARSDGEIRTAGQWVKAVRLALGIRSQEEFAERLDVGRSAVAKWETDIQTPEFDSIRRILKLAPPELRARMPRDLQVPGMTTMSDPSGKLASIKQKLGDALERRADSLSGPQALAIQKDIDALAARLSGGDLDDEGAEAIVDIAIRALQQPGRGPRS